MGGSIALSLLLAALPAAADPAGGAGRRAATPSTALFRVFQRDGDSALGWTTCGATPSGSGCFATGMLTGFARPCALLESASTVTGDTATTTIYVLDSGGTTEPYVSLKVFQAVDTVAGTKVGTVITPVNSVILPLVPGPKVSCAMASGSGVIFAGTDLSETAASITLPDLTVSAVGSFYPPIPISEITADDGGAVALTFGNVLGGFSSGFYVYGPGGEDGGGADFVVGTINAVPLH